MRWRSTEAVTFVQAIEHRILNCPAIDWNISFVTPHAYIEELVHVMPTLIRLSRDQAAKFEHEYHSIVYENLRLITLGKNI